MNILFLFNSFVGNNGNLSGGDVRLIKFFKFLNSKEILFDVILDNNALDLIKRNNIKINKTIKTPKIFDRFPFYISYVLRTLYVLIYFLFHKQYIKTIDIIYSPSDFFPDVLPAYLLKNKKWIQLIHHIYPNWKNRPGNKIINFFGYNLQNFSFKLIKKGANKIILVNTLVKNNLINIGFNKDNCFVSSNGIDINYFSNIKPTKTNYDATFLARLKPSKGIFDLIKIWEIVCKYGDYKLALIGGGDQQIVNKLNKEINEHNLQNNLFLLGSLEDNNAFSILKSSKIFLFPSHEEGWGIAVAEAMSCSLPVISWNLPVYNEIFENNIIQIQENNFENFEKKIIYFFENEDKRLDFAKQANEFIKKYDWNSVFENDFYNILN